MIYLIYNLFSYFDGQGDGILYSRKGALALPGNEHRYLVRRRVAAWLLALGGFVYGALFGWSGLLLLAADSLALALSFSFWHNGAYNLMRAKIAQHEGAKALVKRWTWQYTSLTDTSDWNFTYAQRRNMKLASIVILLIGYIVYFFVYC